MRQKKELFYPADEYEKQEFDDQYQIPVPADFTVVT